MRPPIPYFGSKQLAAERIISAFPAHQHYVEPFGGSLSVLLAKPPVAVETVNDLDGKLMTFWRVLRDRPDDLARVCALTPHSRAEFAASGDLTDDLDDLEVARRVWVHLAQGRAGIRTATGWRFNIDPTAPQITSYLRGYLARIAPAAQRLRSVSLECRPAVDVVADYGRREDVLLYVDPPYLASTRRPGAYAVEMGSDDEHRELAETLRACAASVVLSGYPSRLYEDLYDGWRRVEFTATSTQGETAGDRREVLWVNREASGPDLLDLLNEGAA